MHVYNTIAILFLSLHLTAECCVNEKCFQTPPNCSGASCIVQLNWSEYGSAYNMSMKILASYFSLNEAENYWIAVGTSEKGFMADSQITLCTLSNKMVSVVQVSGYSHGVMPADIGPSLTSQAKLQNSDNYISCQFILHRSLFDYEKNYVFIGGGPILDNLILYHYATPLVSSEVISLSGSSSYPSGYRITDFRILLHASAMITGYGIFMVVGMYTSRYIRPLFEASWYRIHTKIMFSMVFIVAVGLGSIVLKKRTVTTGIHEIIGFIIITLTILQIIIASCRPHKKHEKRNRMTFIHLFIGIALFVLVVINIFLGLTKIQTNIASHIFVIQGLYVIWIVFGSIIGNEVLKYFYGNDQRLYIKKLKLYTMINIGIILMYGCTIIILLNVV